MLIDYGIQSEQSDMRAHVCPSTRKVYIYKTVDGLDAIHKGNGWSANGKTGNVVTGSGRAVPLMQIKGLEIVSIPDDVFREADFKTNQFDDSTSIKGRKAVRVVKELIRRNLFPIPLTIEEVKDEQEQINGSDVIVTTKCKIQVKCDWRVGETGNLFLQTAERNLHGAH